MTHGAGPGPDWGPSTSAVSGGSIGSVGFGLSPIHHVLFKDIPCGVSFHAISDGIARVLRGVLLFAVRAGLSNRLRHSHKGVNVTTDKQDGAE